MINQQLNIFDRELDFIIREIIDNPNFDETSTQLATIERLLQEYRQESIYSFLELYLSKNAEKYNLLDLGEGIDKVNRYLGMLFEELKSLERLNLTLFNQVAYQQEGLRKLNNQALDKLAALKLYSTVDILSVILPGTRSADWLIETEDASVKRMTVADTSNGMVLPIERSDELQISKVELTDSSNGEPGDPRNRERLFQRDALISLADKNPDTYFEYSRMGPDGVRLELTFTFSQETILNAIDVTLVDYPFVQQAQLAKAEYQLSNGQWASWIDTVESLDSDRVLYLNPVKSLKVRLLLESTGSEPIRVGTDLFAQRSILGVKDVRFYKVQYSRQGQVISKVRENVGGDKVSLDGFSYRPTVSDLFNYEIFIRNESEVWESLTLRDTDENDFVNLSNQNLQAKLLVSLNDAEFTSNDSAIRPSRSVGDYETFLASNINPNIYTLSNLFGTLSLGLVQELPYNIGLSRFLLEAYRRETVETGVLYQLPALSSQALSRLRVYVNGRIAVKVDRSAGEGEYTLGNQDSLPSIRFGSLSPNSQVEARLSPELLTFKRQGNRFIATLDNPIVPLKDRIKLERLAEGVEDTTSVVQVGEDTITLDHELIVDFNIKKRVGLVLEDAGYTAVSGSPENPRENLSASLEYYLDRELGILYFFEPTEDQLFLQYTHKDVYTQDTYEVFRSTDGIPQAIGISPENLRTLTITEQCSGSAQRAATANFLASTSPEYWTSVNATLPGDQKTVFLSHGHVLEGSVKVPEDAFTASGTEVPYIDGWTELSSGDYGTYTLGSPSLDDGTYMEWDITDYLFINEVLGLFPSDTVNFVNQVDAADPLDNVGDWSYDSSNGRLRVRSSAVLSTSSVGFFFKEFDLPQSQYSIDYETGRIFFNEAVNAFEVEYQVTPYRISYTPGTAITEFTVDGDSVNVRSSLVSPDQLVYVFYDRILIDSNIEELKSYYSPVISSINLRVA